MKRATSPALDDLMERDVTFPVLDHGHVRVVDYMGNDAAIVQAARVSYGEGTKTPSTDAGLINRLMRDNHTSPFEMCELKLHIKLPIFAARQWIRHRTANVNEYSARYSEVRNEFYFPPAEQIRLQSRSNKQGSEGTLQASTGQYVRNLLIDNAGSAFAAYDAMIDGGVARELARTVLPLSTYTEWYWKIDLHNLLHFIALRASPHAQQEIREYAEVLGQIVESWCPMAWAAFLEYRQNAVTVGASVWDALRDVIQDSNLDMRLLLAGRGVGKSEIEDVMGKLSA